MRSFAATSSRSLWFCHKTRTSGQITLNFLAKTPTLHIEPGDGTLLQPLIHELTDGHKFIGKKLERLSRDNSGTDVRARREKKSHHHQDGDACSR